MTLKFKLVIMGIALAALGACTKSKGQLGTTENPIKFFLVPSVDAQLLESTGKKIQNYLEANTPYKYKFAVPSSFVAVVEAFGTNRADVASINTFGYILANERYGTEARITFLRHGAEDYQAQIIARADSDINSLADLNDKKIAYVDPASASGYLMPAKLFADKKIKPRETVFAQKHDNVVTMVYQKQVDAGATFYSPPNDGKIEDARRLVKTQFPDVEKTIKIVTLTDKIPNDPVVFRKDLSDAMKNDITKALMELQKTPEGREIFYKIYGVTGMVAATDAKYDGVRAMLKALGKSASELTK